MPASFSEVFSASITAAYGEPCDPPGAAMPSRVSPTGCPATLTPVTSVVEVVVGSESPGLSTLTVRTCTSPIFSTPSTSMPRVMLSAIEVITPSSPMTTLVSWMDPEVAITPTVGPASRACEVAVRAADSAFSTSDPVASLADAFGVRLPSETT